MKRKLTAGSTSQSVPVFIQDTSSTTGAGLGSLVYNSSGLTAKYRRQGQSSETTITLATMTLGTWASGGFVADGGGVTGDYELGLPDAAIAASAGVTWVIVKLYGATNMLACQIEIELDTLNYQASGGKVPATIAAGDLATDSVTAAALKADAVTEIQSGLSTLTAAQAVTAILTALLNSSDFNTPGSFGKLIKDNLDAAVSTRNATAPDNAGIASAASSAASAATAASSAATSAASAATSSAAVNGRLPASPAAAGDAMALTSGERTAVTGVIWSALLSGFTTAGSVGKRFVDLFTGMTNLAQWLGAMAAKHTPNSTAVSEINATGAGGGDFSPLSDSEQALRDNYTTGGDTILVGPVVATLLGNAIVSSGTTQAFRYCKLPTGPIVVVDADGDPINLSNADVKLIMVKSIDSTTVDTLTDTDGLTIAGDEGNEVSITYVPLIEGKVTWNLFYKFAGDDDWTGKNWGFFLIQDGPDPRDP